MSSTAQQPMEGVKIFYSYAHEDEKLRDELEKHLSNLEQQGHIAPWHDRQILGGKEWGHEIAKNIEDAQIILLLVSPDFMASRYCREVETPQALQRHEAGQARVIPVILRPVDWKGAAFDKLQALPTNGKPITTWSNQDEGFLDVAKGIRKVVEDLLVGTSVSGGGQKRISTTQLWNIPYPRNPLFTGREDILKRLHDTLSSNKTAALTQAGQPAQPQAISGLGGIGKTQTAVEYAYRYQNDYQAILWAKADLRETLVSDFVTLAGLLNLPEKDAQDQSKAVAAVKSWVQTHTNWLLILDNADDLAMAREFLPSPVKGHILLTTRAQAMGRLAQRIEVEKMGPEEGALFLLRRANILSQDDPIEKASAADRAKAKEISEVLDGLPLALDQAGAYIEETGCGLSSYLDLYQKRGMRLLKERRGLVPDHPEPVATTWSLSFEKVQKANPAAADLLRLCAFLHPDAIPEEIIIEGGNDLGPTLQPVASDPFELNAAIEELRKYSLLRRDPDAKTLTIHRLVQEVLKDGMDQEKQRQWAERTMRAVNSAFPDPGGFTMWQQCQRCLPHAQVCAALIDQWSMEFTEAAELLYLTGYYLVERAQYAEVEPLYQRAIVIFGKALGQDSSVVAACLNNLALLYMDQGKYAEAEPLYQQAIAIDEKVLGPEHPNLAIRLNNLALLYKEQGKYSEAEPLYQRAIAIDEKALGPNHSDLASGLNNLANLYRVQGKYAEAEPLFRRAIAIGEKTLGPEHPFVATYTNNLANLYYSQGKYTQAEPLFRRAIAIGEKTLGPEHPNLAIRLNNLANLYRVQGKYAEAEQLFRRAIAIDEKALGPEHPKLAIWLNNLAELYRKQGKYREAEPLYQRAIAIDEKARPGHLGLATDLKNYAALLRETNREAEAAQMEARAKAMREKHARENPTS